MTCLHVIMPEGTLIAQRFVGLSAKKDAALARAVPNSVQPRWRIQVLVVKHIVSDVGCKWDAEMRI